MDPDLQTAQLTRALNAGEDVWAVHYACESFYDLLDHPPAISAIAVSSVPPGEDRTFSIIDEPGQDAETKALERFYSWLRGRPDAHLVHWNMNKTEFGFDALANRSRYLNAEGPDPPSHSQDRLYDLDELLKHRHGSDYARNPRLSTLITLNAISARYSMTGAEQAEAYRRGEHAALARSTSDRVRAISQIAVLFTAGTLQTERSGPAVRWGGALLDSITLVVELGQRLLDVGDELGRRYGGRAAIELNDEYDYQDVLRALLRLFFGDVRAEDYVPESAGARSRIDFVLREVGLGIELKVMRESLTTAQLGAELLIDSARYQSYGGIRHLVCLVYDHDRLLRNPAGLERDLSRETGGLQVTVKIVR
jgi:hypothetical protein